MLVELTIMVPELLALGGITLNLDTVASLSMIVVALVGAKLGVGLAADTAELLSILLTPET